MRSTLAALAVLATLSSAATDDTAEHRYVVSRFRIHVPKGLGLDAAPYERLLSAPRLPAQMLVDMSLVGGERLDSGVERSFPAEGSEVVRFRDDVRGFVRDVDVLDKDGDRTGLVVGQVESGDSLVLDGAHGPRVGYRLVSTRVEGFDVHTFTAKDGTVQSVQRPHASDTDISGTVDLPVGMATVIFEPDPSEPMAQDLLAYVVERVGR